MTRATLFKLILSMCMGAVVTAAPAQTSGSYPHQPVRILVGYNPGAGTDLVAREIAKRLSDKWNVSVVVENRSGANTIIATNAVAHAKPDGYTLLLTNSSNATNPAIYSELPYDPVNGFDNIALLAIAYNLITAAPGMNIKNVRELISYAKANPGKYTYGSVGIGSSQHLLMEMLSSAAGIELVHVPYKGAGAAMVDVLGGRLSGMIGTISSQQGHVKEGKLQPLFVTGAQRSDVLPEVETLAENGFKDIVSGYWLGLSGPRGMPEDIIQKINKDVNEVLKMPEVINTFKGQAMVVLGGSPKEMDDYFATEMAFWSKAAKTARLEPLQVGK